MRQRFALTLFFKLQDSLFLSFRRLFSFENCFQARNAIGKRLRTGVVVIRLRRVQFGFLSGKLCISQELLAFRKLFLCRSG